MLVLKYYLGFFDGVVAMILEERGSESPPDAQFQNLVNEPGC